MSDTSGGIKSMRLYFKVERILNELRTRGIADDQPLSVEDLLAFDQYHYLGTEAVDHALSALNAGPGKRVLDVGSGVGGPARYMAWRGGCDVTALELQPDLSALAESLTRRCGLGRRVEHLAGDILSGIVSGRGFDGLVAMLVFLHIADRQALFARCREALRPGGTVYIEDYYQRGPLRDGERRLLNDKVYCTYLPSLDEFQDHLRAAGFEGLEVTDMTGTWTGFVRDRLAGFRADRARQVAVHGAEVVEGLEDFYAAVAGLFEGGRLGGLRIVARLARGD